MNRAATAYKMTDRERQNLSQVEDHSNLQAISEIWAVVAKRHGSIVALHNAQVKPEVSLTYAQLYQQMQQFAAGLQALGIQPGEIISLFSDNSHRWLIADQGMMMAGAANTVRSSQAEKAELLFILEDSDSVAVAVENLATLKKIADRLADRPLKFAVLLSDETPPEDLGLKVLNFPQLMELGAQPPQPIQQNHETLATLIYTSGTTGKPKGVMLTHGNLLHQVNTFGTIIQPQPGDRVLSILPSWHAYERTVEYFLLSQACTQSYTSIRAIKKDLKEFKPHYMVSVPRIWESVYDGVQKQFREQPERQQKLIQFFLGISQQYIQARRISQNLDLLHQNPSAAARLSARAKAAALAPIHALGEKIVYKKVRDAVTGGEFRYAISGGGSLAKHLDDFFEIVGIGVLVGYGLTETAPVTNVRRPWRNLRGSAGPPIAGTEIRIVDPETRQTLPQGQRGLVLLRGDQIMQGYYGNPEATRKAIDPDRWFDSGDLGWVTTENDLVLTGRAKDTIVLTNGENIEPQPIEDACLRSPYIDQIMLVGQDQKSIGALIVPNLEALQQKLGPEPDLTSKPVQDLFRQELNREVQNRPGYRADDRIATFRLIAEPFTIENGLLTQTLKVRRNVVADRYRSAIEEMFA